MSRHLIYMLVVMLFISSTSTANTKDTKTTKNLMDMLENPNISELSFDQIIELLANLATIRRNEGIMGLDEFAVAAKGLLGTGLRLMVEGIEPELVRTILGTNMLTLVQNLDTRYTMILEGIVSVKARHNPRLLGLKLHVFHLSSKEPASLHDTSSSQKLSSADFDKIVAIFMNMTETNRREGVSALENDEEIQNLRQNVQFFDYGMSLVLERTHSKRIQQLLLVRKGALIRDYDIRLTLVLQGLSDIQAGAPGHTVKSKLWFLYLKERHGATVFRIGIVAIVLTLVVVSGYAMRKRRDLRQTERALIQVMEKELQAAHDMQVGLMPEQPPEVSGLDVAGRCIPANHVGGDFFQYFKQDGKLALAMADVTGHGMEAAIPVVMFSGILDNQIRHGDPIESLFKELNHSLYRTLDSRTFVCFSLGEVDLSNLTLRLCNAACPYPYHFRSEIDNLNELQVDAYPLGVRPDTIYDAIDIQLHPGDYIVLLSDGITEAENREGEQFGYERTPKAILKACQTGVTAEKVLEQILKEVDAFKDGAAQADDMTCLVLRVQ